MKIFNRENLIIGMIHLRALPGAPNFGGSVKEIIKSAAVEAQLYKKCGVKAVLIENMHDLPYLNKKVGPEIVSVVSSALYEIKRGTDLICGAQILAGANKEALAAVYAAGGEFIRAEGFVFAHVGDEGIFNSDAGELLRYRKSIGADKILIFTDIKKKHSSHSITADTDIAETARAAEFFLSDGVVVTGTATGVEPSLDELEKVKSSVNIPVISGSGATPENIKKLFQRCDAVIAGSYLKKGGDWRNPPDEKRIKTLLRSAT